MNTGYIHVEPVLGNYVHGDGLLGDQPINPSGQWDAHLPETHQQNENGFEVNDCVTEATINCVETLEIQEYGTNSGWARRFLAKNSGTDIRGGNDPQTVSQSLKNNGCVQSSWYPFTATTFQEFYQDLTQALKTLAIGTFAKFSYGHSWVNADPQSMMEALTYSPLSAAGYAWETDTTTGYYITPQGAVPEHDFMVYGYEVNNFWKIRDSYPPFEKKLAWNYQFTGIKRHTLHRQAANTPAQQTAWDSFMSWLQVVVDQMQRKLGLGYYGRDFGANRSTMWRTIEKAFEEYVPKVDCFDGSKLFIQLHHSQDPFHSNPARELDPTQLRWVGRKRHLEEGHNGNFQSLNFSFDQRVEDYQNRKFWNGSEWVVNTKPRIKYKLTDEELQQWNKRFGTNWSYNKSS